MPASAVGVLVRRFDFRLASRSDQWPGSMPSGHGQARFGEGEAFGEVVVLGCLGAGGAGVGAPPAGRTSCTGASSAGVQEVRGWIV